MNLEIYVMAWIMLAAIYAVVLAEAFRSSREHQQRSDLYQRRAERWMRRANKYAQQLNVKCEDGWDD